MTYYVLHKDEPRENAMFDCNQLGESSFDSFYPAQGLSGLMNIVEKSPETLLDIQIIKENGNDITVEQFLTEISKLKVRYNRFS